MTEPTDTTETNSSTKLAIEYDVDPIEIRDPVAETLGVLAPGQPFVITYADAVKAAGHSCPTASGAYRITQIGLDALYPDELPIRSNIEVEAAGPRDDTTYGVMGNIISYITGAAEADGFGGLAGEVGDRQDLLAFEAFDPEISDPTFRFRRTDTGDVVEVQYHVTEVTDGGPAMGNLQQILDGSASDSQREAFIEAWHGRVREVLSDDTLFTVEAVASDTHCQ